MSIRELLTTVKASEPIQAGGLQVFPLSWPTRPRVDYATLDQASAAGWIEITEVSEGGSVPLLRLTNKADRPVFLLAGEMLAGGKQNRVLNTSLLAAAGASITIPVTCVERGRWARRSAHFDGSGTTSHAALRKLMHSQVTRSYHECRTPTSDQGEVWREVSRKLDEVGSSSETMSLHQAFDDSSHRLSQMMESLPAPRGAHGAAFAYGGKLVGLDLFDRPETLEELWPKLLRAYALDALHAGESPAVLAAEVQKWIAEAGASREEVFDSPGLGEDVRLEGATLEASCLRVEGQPLHVEAFSR
jgi:hypothetical protein